MTAGTVVGNGRQAKEVYHMKGHQSSAVKFLSIGFALVLLSVSGLTSFAFFVEFFPEVIPEQVLNPDVGSLISGGIGVVLFDLATVIWLILFLNDAETEEQRAIALIMAGVTFIGSAAASVAYLSLTAKGSMDVLDVTTKNTVASFALGVVLLGIVANFGASQMYQRYEKGNKAKVRNSDREDVLQAAEDEQAGHLDALIAQNVREKLAAIAPELAEEQARRLVSRVYRVEAAKYADTAPSSSSPDLDGEFPHVAMSSPVVSAVEPVYAAVWVDAGRFLVRPMASKRNARGLAETKGGFVVEMPTMIPAGYDDAEIADKLGYDPNGKNHLADKGSAAAPVVSQDLAASFPNGNGHPNP